jgi:hypothetical protein
MSDKDESPVKAAGAISLPRRFFGNPLVGVLGSLASIVGLILALYFYWVSREKPELMFFVHPAKAAVVRMGQTSHLAVQFDGQDVTCDVTTAQIAFWNAGKKPIRSSAILEPLAIRVSSKKIFEVRLRKSTREVTRISIDSSDLTRGEVRINWSILEQNDGGILQIVYAGDENTAIEAHSVIEGQPEVRECKFTEKASKPGEEYARRGRRRIDPFLYIQLGTGVVLAGFVAFLLRLKNPTTFDRVLLIFECPM